MNLSESSTIVSQLLDVLPDMFKNNREMNTNLGSAIEAGYRVMGQTGGKMVIFQASLPSVGKGSLKPRAGDGRVLGTKDEFKMLNPADLYYKTQAVEFSRQQICCEIFVASSGSYSDIATLSCLSKYTGGGLNYYQNFHHQKDGDRLGKDIKRVLLRETAWESVARVRVTQGCRISVSDVSTGVQSWGTCWVHIDRLKNSFHFFLSIVFGTFVLLLYFFCTSFVLLFTSFVLLLYF